jgi:P-type Cu+ transporter
METKQTLSVKGMHCSSCANIIGRTLKKIPGVSTATVNYATETASIGYDSGKVTPEIFNEKLMPYGYSLNISTSTESDSNNYMSHDDVNTTAIKVTFPLALIVFIIMLWDILAKTLNIIPEFPIPMQTLNVILFILASIALWGFGSQFVSGVIRFARFGHANMDTLVGLGTMTAYFYSSFILLFPLISKNLGLPEVYYFDITIVVTGFILFGKYLEKKAKKQTGSALEKLMGLTAKTAIVVRGDIELEIPVSEVLVGDIVKVKPGTKIPVDGEVTEGESSVDESMVTGESIPTDMKMNFPVIGGTMNLDGVLFVKATKVGSETLLSQIVKMVRNAQDSKAPVEQLADKISAIFVPIVLGISGVTFLIWMIIGNIYLPSSLIFPLALTSLIGVLVIACPCALGLATPTAIVAAVGRGAGMGILIKDAESIEKLEKVTTVVMDKTGTLTRGKPEVTDVILSNAANEKDLLRILATLEQHSEHPIAQAIVEKAKQEKIILDKISDFKIFGGKGIEGKIGNEFYRAGNISFLKDYGVEVNPNITQEFTSIGKTPVFLSDAKQILGIVYVADKLKESAKVTINKLQKIGIKVIMLSGDEQKTAEHIGHQAGIETVIAGVRPHEKGKYIEKLKDDGETLAMVGDGVNDAPALAIADVGIAMSTGTDIAMTTANITLLHGDIAKVYEAILLSKKTMQIVRQNLFWAFFYNVVGIPIAAGILYPITHALLSPVFAGAAMALSSVSVVTNSLRLKRVRII